MRPISIYIHIPFCLRRCPYCDFNTYAVPVIPEKEYVSAVLSELDYRASLDSWKGRTVETVYFGGGTPSLFRPSSLGTIINSISSLFPLSNNAEISMEGNPGTVDSDSLKGYRDAGINRLSLGAQSFNPDMLRTLGRIHTVEQTEAALSGAREAGFRNIGLDIIYGTPGQTLEMLQSDLNEIVKMAPQHVSAYGLTIEKGTPLFAAYKKGAISLPSEDEILLMMSEVNTFLPSAGYARYEVSNYARPGYEARHNIVYWSGGDYLGLGAGAHSLLVVYDSDRKQSAERWSNYPGVEKYITEAVAYGKAQSWEETLAAENLMFEFFFLGLRKTAGVSNRDFRKVFNADMFKLYPSTIEVLADQGLIRRDDDGICLTSRGFELADSVIENFVKAENA